MMQQRGNGAYEIHGDYEPLYSTHQMAGTDVKLAMAQQRPAPHEPLIMNPNLLAGQVDLPRFWEQQVVDRQGRPIPLPTQQPRDRMGDMPLIFPVRDDKQPVNVPTQLVQDQGMSQAPMQQI